MGKTGRNLIDLHSRQARSDILHIRIDPAVLNHPLSQQNTEEYSSNDHICWKASSPIYTPSPKPSAAGFGEGVILHKCKIIWIFFFEKTVGGQPLTPCILSCLRQASDRQQRAEKRR